MKYWTPEQFRDARRVLGLTRTELAEQLDRARLNAKGLIGRYQTGAKAWAATITQRAWPDGEVSEYANFGRDDRAPKFKKLNGVSLA
jgi:hypothetical protein